MWLSELRQVFPVEVKEVSCSLEMGNEAHAWRVVERMPERAEWKQRQL